jgi:ATP-dependent DNA ligase
VNKINRWRHILGVVLPRVQPIIPTRRKEPFDHPEWLFDFKYDGFRALCYIEQGRCRLTSRNGNMLSRFEALADQVAAVLDVDEAVIDGEVIVVDETGRPQFYELLRVPRRASYVAFDILWLDGTDLRSLPFDERRRRLQRVLCTNDLEGIVAKRLADPYDTRVRWLKIKNPDYSQKEGLPSCSTGRRRRGPGVAETSRSPDERSRQGCPDSGNSAALP